MDRQVEFIEPSTMVATLDEDNDSKAANFVPAQQASRFLKLPTEIRVMIYRDLVQWLLRVYHSFQKGNGNLIDIKVVMYPDGPALVITSLLQSRLSAAERTNILAQRRDRSFASTWNVDPLGFLATCRQIYQEAVEVVYEKVRMRISTTLVRLFYASPRYPIEMPFHFIQHVQIDARHKEDG
jgi:hypothetical protein